jgi:hypothetical protein
MDATVRSDLFCPVNAHRLLSINVCIYAHTSLVQMPCAALCCAVAKDVCHVSDSQFVDLDGYNAAVAWKGFGNFVNCTFSNNTLFPTNFGAGLIESDVEDEMLGESGMRLEQCTFSETTVTDPSIPVFLTDNRAVNNTRVRIPSLPCRYSLTALFWCGRHSSIKASMFCNVLQAAVYTDTQGVDVCNIVGADPLMDVPPCMNSAPLPLSAAASIPKFIYSTNSWLRRTQEACSPILSTCLEHFEEELSNA